MTSWQKSTGFRPLAGIMVLIYSLGYNDKKHCFLFPSPCGDYGSYRRQHRTVARGKGLLVSVPLRGLWFLSPEENQRNERTCVYVSVPLRGLWFLS